MVPAHTSLVGLLNRGLGDLLDFVYPPRCGVCQRGLDRGERLICRSCWSRPKAIAAPFCASCGLSLTEPATLCAACREHQHLFSFARSWGIYDEIFGRIIHLFKYRHKQSLARPLAKLLAATLRSDNRFASAQVVMPVPLHGTKRRTRGYNQSQLLARELSRMVGLTLLDRAMIRTMNTRSQSTLNLEERRENVRDVFQARDASGVCRRRIVLVDDVLTTGATADACAAALWQAGAAQVAVLTLARAAPSSSAVARGETNDVRPHLRATHEGASSGHPPARQLDSL